MSNEHRENLRQLFLDFIDLGEPVSGLSSGCPSLDEEVWQRHLKTYDDLTSLVLRLTKQHKEWRDIAISLGWKPTPVTSDTDDDSHCTCYGDHECNYCKEGE